MTAGHYFTSKGYFTLFFDDTVSDHISAPQVIYASPVKEADHIIRRKPNLLPSRRRIFYENLFKKPFSNGQKYCTLYTDQIAAPAHRMLWGVAMLWYVMIGFFAAVGALALLWLWIGLILSPFHREEVGIVCPPGREAALLRRYRWLRELGLVRCSIVLLDSPLPAHSRTELTQHYPGVTFAASEDWKKEKE